MADTDGAGVALLQAAVALCKRQPSLLQTPQCQFFKDFVQELVSSGAIDTARQRSSGSLATPEAPSAAACMRNPFNISSMFTADWSDGESSDLDAPPQQQQLDPDQPSGGPTPGADDCGSPSEGEDAGRADPPQPTAVGAAMMRAAELVGEAQYQCQQGTYPRALSLLTEAITTCPGQAYLFVERAELHLRMRKPTAAVRDCDSALQINPDSSGAHKARGRAFRVLKNWELSAHHLRLGNQLLYDDSSYALQKRVESRVKEKRLEEIRLRLEASDGVD
eukprot:TRINITY_DN27154_c0_g1_i1.p1 TRINITY_DN27154_c0_g1~~TRINITY_DN27154_c0_g1_i1.p1  ORF type:complete len:278 (+),score=114.79 TRINITY_DN27154_c0_g1_i1:53-886(+)